MLEGFGLIYSYHYLFEQSFRLFVISVLLFILVLDFSDRGLKESGLYPCATICLSNLFRLFMISVFCKTMYPEIESVDKIFD